MELVVGQRHLRDGERGLGGEARVGRQEERAGEGVEVKLRDGRGGVEAVSQVFKADEDAVAAKRERVVGDSLRKVSDLDVG